MTDLEKSLFTKIDKIPIIDPHSHIDPHKPAARSLWDILSYPYYTSLSHSSGMDPDRIKYTVPDDARARAILEYMPGFASTAQFRWFADMLTDFFDLPADISADWNVDAIIDHCESRLQSADWSAHIKNVSNIKAVFTSHPLKDDLDGIDLNFYIPSLRVDDLVLSFESKEVRARLIETTDIQVTNANSLRLALHKVFDRLTRYNLAACTTSLPPDLSLSFASETKIDGLVAKATRGDFFTPEERNQMATFTLFELAQRCQEHQVPMHILFGVIRDVYDHGVINGTDLFDQRCSLVELHKLFNAFPNVKFPVSVISHAQNHELIAYAWIYHNVYAQGHWWYSNLPAFIFDDLCARMHSLPANKMIGYFSDAHSLEFVLPKFRMYKRELAKILAREYVTGLNWSEERAIELARDILYRNVVELYGLQTVKE